MKAKQRFNYTLGHLLGAAVTWLPYAFYYTSVHEFKWGAAMTVYFFSFLASYLVEEQGINMPGARSLCSREQLLRDVQINAYRAGALRGNGFNAFGCVVAIALWNMVFNFWAYIAIYFVTMFFTHYVWRQIAAKL